MGSRSLPTFNILRNVGRGWLSSLPDHNAHLYPRMWMITKGYSDITTSVLIRKVRHTLQVTCSERQFPFGDNKNKHRKKTITAAAVM